jgi:heme/copper-type cytochrome/quinol oxidase subunit 3
VHTNTWAGAFNTFVLLTSSLAAVLAHQAAEKKDGAKAARLLMFTVLGGATFLCVKAVEWTNEIRHGYTLSSSTFWSFYYTAAGLHGLHVIAGMVIMLFVAADAKKNKELQRVENVGLYWHFVDIVWIAIFTLVYLIP